MKHPAPFTESSILFTPEVFTLETQERAFTTGQEYEALDISSLGTVLFLDDRGKEHVISNDGGTLDEYFVKLA